MKFKLFLMVLTVSIASVQAQKYISKNAHIWFYSHTPMEDIEAHNNEAVSVLDASTGDVAFNLLVKAFEFKRALMQEHFNENFMESDKIPKASFKGKITNLDKINFKKDGVYPAEVSGDLTIHGVSKPLTTRGTIEVKGSTIIVKAKFKAAPKDFDIQVPQVVQNKIAHEFEVNVDASYNPT